MARNAQSPDDKTFLQEGLCAVTGLVARRPRVALWLVGLSVCVAVVFSLGFLKFKTDRADLIDPNAEFQQRWLSYTEDFGAESDIVVAVEGESNAEVVAVLAKIARKLKSEPELFTGVLYKIEPSRLERKGLQHTSPASLRSGLARIDQVSPVLRGDWSHARLDRVAWRLRNQLDVQLRSRPATIRGERAYNADLARTLEHAHRLSSSLANFDTESGQYYLPWPDVVETDEHLRAVVPKTRYFLSGDGSLGLLKVRPAEESLQGFDGAAASIERLRAIVDEIQTQRKAEERAELSIGLTGIPVLEHDEMSESQFDMLKAAAASFLGVGVLLVIGFRSLRHPFLAMVMLMVGMAWAVGYTTLVVGHLNILSVSFAAILIGLGIDFAIHYLAKYLELRKEGEDLTPALQETSSSVGVGIVAAAVTTALAFFCATLTQFLGVAELGIIAGGGILLCAAATFVVLPALVSLSDRGRATKALPIPIPGDMLSGITYRIPLIVFLVSSVAVLGLAASMVSYDDGKLSFRVGYDHNLLNLQAEELESVALQNRIFEKTENSVLYAVSLADSPQQARELRRKFEALPSVGRVEEFGSSLAAPPSRETLSLLQAYRSRLANLPAKPSREQIMISNPAPIGSTVEQLYLTLRRISNAPIDPALSRLAATSAQNLDGWLDRFSGQKVWEQVTHVNEYQLRMTLSLWGQLRGLATAADPTPITVADFPKELRGRYVSDSGQWLVQVFPKEQIWEIGPLTQFVSEVRSVDPAATGTPLQNYEASQQIRSSYQTAAVYALGVILVVLLVDFLSASSKALVLLPPLVVVAFYGVLQFMHGRPQEIELLIMMYLAAVIFFAALLDGSNLRDALLAMTPPVLGGLMMFGAMGLLGVDLNPANLIVLPLVLGIGVDDGVHVVHDFRAQRGDYRTSSSTMNGIILTSLTSMIGFGSMMLASHRGLYSVGLTLVIGVAGCLFVSLVLLPAVLTLIDRRPELAESESSSDRDGEGGNESRQQSSNRKNRRQNAA